MPNFCYNTISLISSKKNDLEQFYIMNYKNEKRILSFNNLVPVSDIESGIALNHSDCCEAWGTKWDAMEVEVWRNYEPNTSETEELDKKYNLVYSFCSAWSPPTSWLHKVAEMNPHIEFELEYKESGCDFWGKQFYQKGILIEEDADSLGRHNWNVCNREKLDRIIDENMPLITKENYTLRIETIVDDFSFQDGNWENIDDYVQKLVEERLGFMENPPDISENVFIVKHSVKTSSL